MSCRIVSIAPVHAGRWRRGRRVAARQGASQGAVGRGGWVGGGGARAGEGPVAPDASRAASSLSSQPPFGPSSPPQARPAQASRPASRPSTPSSSRSVVAASSCRSVRHGTPAALARSTTSPHSCSVRRPSRMPIRSKRAAAPPRRVGTRTSRPLRRSRSE